MEITNKFDGNTLAKIDIEFKDQLIDENDV